MNGLLRYGKTGIIVTEIHLVNAVAVTEHPPYNRCLTLHRTRPMHSDSGGVHEHVAVDLQKRGTR